MRLKLLHDTILIKQEENISYEGILVMPELNDLEKISPCARVYYIGPKSQLNLKKGDRILFDRFHGKPWYMDIDGEKFRVINDDYVWAVIDDNLKVEAFRRICR
jgi:co-chaperonin GroES (HSP10)